MHDWRGALSSSIPVSDVCYDAVACSRNPRCSGTLLCCCQDSNQRNTLSILQVLLQLMRMSESWQRMWHTVLETWTEVSAWIYFFTGQTGVRIPVGIGQRTVFLEQCWGPEGEGLLKLAHTQMWDILMSNLALLNIISLHGTGILRRVTLCESINLLYEMSRFQLDKRCDWWDLRRLSMMWVTCSSATCFSQPKLFNMHISEKATKNWQSRTPVLLVRITHYRGFELMQK